jgi:hypothetical protein
LFFAKAVIVTLDSPAGKLTGSDEAPLFHSPLTESVPEVAVGAKK